jgi:predicted transcriptional regulator
LSTKKSISKNKSNDQKNNDNSLIGKTSIAKNTSKTNKSEQLSTQKTRNFFTVEEDWTILESIKKNKDYNISAISNQVGLKLGRSTESIRDRIKKYLSKIRAND